VERFAERGSLRGVVLVGPEVDPQLVARADVARLALVDGLTGVEPAGQLLVLMEKAAVNRKNHEGSRMQKAQWSTKLHERP
jgi:hypothetical protein